MPPSPPWCARLLLTIDAADQHAVALASTLTPHELNWRPRPDEWSVGQCLEHLYITNEAYCPAIAAALESRPAGTAQEITPGWFGRWFIRNYIEPTYQTKRRAPSKIAPPAQVDPTILERFLGSNQRARALVQRAAGYDVNRIRFRNPFVPLIRFTVGTGLEILTKHEHRHLMQAERVRDALSRGR